MSEVIRLLVSQRTKICWLRLKEPSFAGGSCPPATGCRISISLATAILSTIGGAIMAWIVARTDFRHKTLVTTLTGLSFCFPGFILAMAWIIIGSPGGLINGLLGDGLGWTWLKLEKLIEIWLEGRALGERRRWAGDGTDKTAAPGDLPANLRMDDRTGKDRCFPISLNEYNTNKNLTPPG